MVKLPEGPDSGFCDMNGRGVEIGCKIDQMAVFDLFNRSDVLRFYPGLEFIEPGG